MKTPMHVRWLVMLLVLSVAPAYCCGQKVPQGVSYDENVEYGRAGDVSLQMDIARPEKADGLRPCVVVIHGGGWRAGDRHAHTDICFHLAQRGYVAATISYRFAPAHIFPAQVEDAKCAVRFLRASSQKYQIDKAKFGAIGASAGAHLSMLLGVMDKDDGLEGDGGSPTESSKVQAVVSFFGPTDLAGEDTPAATYEYITPFLGGTLKEKPEVHRQASPLTYVSTGDAPILLLTGTKDPLVPHTQAYKMADAMTEKKIAGRVIVYVGAGHGWGGNDLLHSLEESYEFFDQHLKK